MFSSLERINIPNEQLSEDDLYRRINKKEKPVPYKKGIIGISDDTRTEEGGFSRVYDNRVFYIYDLNGPMPSMWPIDGFKARYEIIATTLGEALFKLFQMGKDLRFLNLSRELKLWDNGKTLQKRYYNWAGLDTFFEKIPDSDTGIDLTGCNFSNQSCVYKGQMYINNMNLSHCIFDNFIFRFSGNNYNLDYATGHETTFINCTIKEPSQHGTLFLNPIFYSVSPERFDIKCYRTPNYNEKDNIWDAFGSEEYEKEFKTEFYNKVFYYN